MGCKGLHCDGCRHGGGAGAVIALLIIVALGLRKAWPHVVSAAEIAGWTIAAACGTAVVITCGVLTARALRTRARRRAASYRRSPVVIDGMQLYAPPLPHDQRPAIGAPRRAASWPPPGWQVDARPWIGGDGDEHRPR
jgi:hypothetical protein